jgi:phosphatidylglycerol---prolipoprotein diacylglyceryl transferase
MYPVLFQIGSFKLHAWGLLLLVGFLAAVWRATRAAPRYNFDPALVWDCSLLGLFGGVVGGRIAFILQELPHYAKNPAEIFMIWTGGMTSYGGIIGGLAVGIWAAKKRGMNVGDAADIAAVSMPIGYFFGRLGCFLNGCCYGTHCDAPWGITFKDESGLLHERVHPTQLYSMLASVLMYGVLVFLEKRPRRRYRGELLPLFAALYGLYRFIVEFWRAQGSDKSFVSGLSSGQWMSLAAFIIGLGLYFFLPKQNDRLSR